VRLDRGRVCARPSVREVLRTGQMLQAAGARHLHMVEGNEGVGMPVGERLRGARLERGLSLDDVSRDTKIQAWILDAIERDEISRVPGGIFIRGYLTSYARTVLLDPGEVLAAYSTEHPVPMEPPPPAP